MSMAACYLLLATGGWRLANLTSDYGFYYHIVDK